MIRCSCGEFFGNACQHAEHKRVQTYPNEHRSVCSVCGEEFSKYPLPEKGVHFAETTEGSIVWLLCDNCRKEKQSVDSVLVDRIIDYETGDMTELELVDMFQDLITSGLAWQLQGHYGRMAMSLIENGWCYTTLNWKGEYCNED